jgi:hypothetical protein
MLSLLLRCLLVQRSAAPEVPPESDWPDASTTGAKGALIRVPAEATSGATWTWDAGDKLVMPNANGVTVEGLDADGQYYTNGKTGVTFRNCKARPLKSESALSGFYVEAANTTIEDFTVINRVTSTAANSKGLKGVLVDGVAGTIIQRGDISGMEDGVYIAGANTQVLDNYIHDLCPYDEVEDPHQDGIQLSGNGSTVQGNNIELAGDTSSAYTGDTSTGVTVTGNRLRAGGHVLRIHDEATNVYTDNRIFREAGTGFSYIDVNTDGTGSATVTGNVDDDTGAPIAFP